ncbi:MAG TPA: PD-(D/E)XK nuclease family protein [Pseudonocardiaceae bacterium]|nr:PD-(D/E)XK nuclease family protein [Pseudonocardiaceae bacterium]
MTDTLADRQPATSSVARRRPALSPSRAADFKQCPLLYRFRVVDRLPETPSRAQVRGTVVHAVLERLFALPADRRDPAAGRELVAPAWHDVLADNPELAELFTGPDDPEQVEWLESTRALVDGYFALEDPRAVEPEACELLVEAELATSNPHDGESLLLRGYIDRIDVAASGDIRVVDYKTGAVPREVFEAKALFQMKFYALALLRIRGVVPRQLRLLYLANQQTLSYTPDEAELIRFERTLAAIWSAIQRAARSGDFRPNPSRMCDWCDHKPCCPAFGGTPPPYPGWPGPSSAGEDDDHPRQGDISG